MFRILLAASLIMLTVVGCARTARGELAIYDWEAQRTAAQAHGAQDLRCVPESCPDPQARHVYVVDAPRLTSADLDRKSVRAVRDPATGQPLLYFSFTASGKRRFALLTRELAERGKARGRPQHLLVVIDDRVYASPSIDFRRFPAGLPGDTGVQMKVASMEEAEKLAEGLGD
jgi:preprotein translocase subunit SecD